MNVNPIITTALASLNIPVVPNHYDGTGTEYIVFYYADERPTMHADDTDLFDKTVIQVHYFTLGNPQTNKKAIRRLMKASGFIIINTQEIYEEDTKLTRVIVECEIEGVIND